MALLLDILSWALVLGGAAFGIVGGIGMLRMPDLFSRMHAAGLIDTLGLGLIAIGLMLQAGFTIVSLKLFLLIAFVFFTSPTGTHALAKAALHGGVRPRTATPSLDHAPGRTLDSEVAAAERAAEQTTGREREPG